MTQPTLSLDPIRPVLPADTATHVDVLARVRVPDLPDSATTTRPPLNLAIVIDRSGSMQGRPIEAAKDAAQRMISGLKAGDRVAVIAYDHEVETISPSADALAAKEVMNAVARISTRGMTNLHGGWLAGAEQVAEHLRKDAINRVILLSDGMQNKGVVDPDEIARQCAYMAGLGVETSTYGVGQNFNEDLMAAMAAKGQGNAYYGESADDLVPAFETELGILSNTVGRNVRIRAKGGKQTQDVRLLNSYDALDDGWRLPNLVADAEVWAVLRIQLTQIPASKSEAKLLDVEVAYDDPDGQPATALSAKLKLPVVAKASYDAADENPTVADRVKEVEAARIQLAAKQDARQGNWQGVDAAVSALRGMAGENAYVGEVADQLAGLSQNRDANLLSKEITFAAAAMQTRYAGLDEDTASLSPDASSKSYTSRRARQGRHANK